MRISRLILVALAAMLLTAGAALGHTVTVGPGDTLGGIAAASGSSAEALASANGIADVDLIVVGQRLTVPHGSGGGGGSEASGSGGGDGGLTVRPGDTLGAIAARAGTSVSALASANGIADPDLIVVGRRLTVPGGSGGGGETGAASSTSTTSAVPAGGYRVSAGDTLSGIATAIGTTSSALASLNGIRDPNRLVVGTILWVPTSAVPADSPSGSAGGGDVRALIQQSADRHGVDPALVRAVAWQESGWNQSAVSSAGAVGVMQLLPSTASWFGPAVLGRSIDPNDVAQNIDGGTAYLAYLQRESGSQSAALASYYQGLTSVRRNGPLPETQLYVANVLAQVGRV